MSAGTGQQLMKPDRTTIPLAHRLVTGFTAKEMEMLRKLLTVTDTGVYPRTQYGLAKLNLTIYGMSDTEADTFLAKLRGDTK